MKKYLSYEEFGAVGDGVTDDFDAIIACHNEANRTGTPVKTKDGATYYIGGKAASAVIKTDVDFGKSKFIIDDRSLENIHSRVFNVESDYESFELKIGPVSKNDRHLELPHKGNLFVRIFNSDKMIFIRKGLNMNTGTPLTDCFVLDENGRVYPSIDWDYEKVTRAYARCTDDKPIHIKGGIFLTIANQAESFYNYHKRGINVSRSHVTISDFEHYVEGEGEHGAPYHGFITTHDAFDVTIRDGIVTPRFIYWTASKIPGKTVAMGSYDLSFSCSIDVRCINVKQSIDINDRRYWGIYTSNFCKNLYLENCVFSRFDAHQGVTNVTIKNCRLGRQSIQLIGHGDFLIEDSVMDNSSSSFISLRGDYGSIWDGNITIRRCEWINKNDKLLLIDQCNAGDHDYGYECVMARDIKIEDFKLSNGSDTPKEQTDFAILSNCEGANPSLPFAYVTPDSITLSGIKIENGADYVITKAPQNFKNLKVTVKG